MPQHDLYRTLSGRLLQDIFILGGGLFLAIEVAVMFIIPCFIAIVLDIASAYFLNRRLHKRFPDKVSGKFKSSYMFRVMYTMFVIFLLIVLANYVDDAIIKNTDISVRFTMGVFLFYECWSILENWSSENNNKLAKALQRIMVNKAERHFDIILSDILLNESITQQEISIEEENTTLENNKKDETHRRTIKIHLPRIFSRKS